MELRGAHVVVTGASRGIGEALARAFAGEGSRVTLVARSADVIDAMALELGGRAYPADLTDRAQVAQLIEQVEAKGGAIDVLVNNAALAPAGDYLSQDPDEIDRTYQLNLVTPAQLCRQVVPRMLAQGRGHIVNVSSMVAAFSFPGFTAYASSKSGLTHFHFSLQLDLKNSRVDTTLVELGPVRTGMLDLGMEYTPTGDAFRRLFRLHMLVELRTEKVANMVLRAVRRGKPHVRLPRRAALIPVLANIPRQAAAALL
ncbi:MAG: SDR family oxidoreductase [bacterium]|nr:SDR family oxidoreductase [bacterium]